MKTFAVLADTLVADYDVVDLLQLLVDSCHDLLDAPAAGILLANSSGELELVASTSEAARIVETMQLSAEAGPCIQSFRTGETVSLPEIRDSPIEWEQFRDSALQQGFRSVHSVPMRLRDNTIGALNLLRDAPGELEPLDQDTARAFADVATVGILHERSLREARVVQEQLQGALNSRILIEQAKGVVAYTRKVTPDEAFLLIRSYSKSHQRSILKVARQLIDLELSL